MSILLIKLTNHWDFKSLNLINRHHQTRGTDYNNRIAVEVYLHKAITKDNLVMKVQRENKSYRKPLQGIN